MLAIALIILKYISLLILARLLATAFGLEFGVSRQYLRLLDRLFVETKRLEDNSIATTNDNNNNIDNHINSEPNATTDHDTDTEQTTTDGGQASPIIGTRRRRLKAIRRCPTPDGPPVFLLDDSDLEEQANEDEEEKDDDEAILKACGAMNKENTCDDHDTNNNNNKCQDSKCRINNNYRQFIRAYRKKQFHLEDVSKFVQKGIAAIVDDEVTKRFTKEELKTWNLLTRTDSGHHQFMSKSIGLAWFLGLIFRYTCLFPLRIMFTIAGYLWLVVAVCFACILPRWCQLRDKCFYVTSIMAFRMLSCGITSRLCFHNCQFRPKKGDICVANHTSPVDVVLLACDNCYALVGQRHGGILGLGEDLLSRATNNVWFDRTEMKDRLLVTERLREHIKDKDNWPILIFPEGTCINNSAVMLFRKGSFEITDRVCPIAMKYDLRFGDAFWDSSKYSYLQYYLMLMSSWAIKCDVWYLPPMYRLDGEPAVEFARRVKAEIARQAGLKNLNWDGQLKRQATKEIWKEQQQEDFAKRLNLD